jgi:hypothetical protein
MQNLTIKNIIDCFNIKPFDPNVSDSHQRP